MYESLPLSVHLRGACWPPFVTIEYAGCYVMLLATAYYGWRFFSVRKERKRKKAQQEMREEKRSADVSFLRAQLNPHFIFNSLNFIYCTVEPYSIKAADAVVKLSELMQYTLRESGDGCICLEEEVKYIRNYIHLISLRYEPDYYVLFEVMGDVKSVRIPTMLLIPFVENAVKHGIVYNRANPVKIWLDVTGSVLTFNTVNLTSNQLKPWHSGVGIGNVRRRLDLLYPKRYSLRIEECGQIFTVVLIIFL
ncbi:sensor histidine kinase [Chitinophaga sp. GCM10012297]|uniref:Histidine kinase n=1 Tax=Chitinophaga chungangae TaxID=2821488 RepID=A0ABS3YIJ7_9BACT|nr:histidine kinase [Chitinophaga chungangae]MBO9154517.1 histidine kinase [Chitinophaga chungangae]